MKKLKIAAVITKQLSDKVLRDIKISGADIAEVRVDYMQDKALSEITDTINRIKKIGLPVICTIRKDRWRLNLLKNSEKERLEYFQKFIPLVDLVDIEYDAKRIRGEVIAFAKRMKKKVIFSYHNFNEIPPENVLRRILLEFKKSGADIIKIAGYARNINDAMRLMAFVKKISKYNPVIGIAMGRAGEFTRVYGGLFGSCLTYGYVDKKVAPGQLSISRLRREIDRVYSDVI